MNTSRWAAADCRHLPHFERLLCAFDLEQPSPEALGLANLSLLGLDVAAEIVVASSVAGGIETFNQRAELDLIVMGSGRNSASSRLTRGTIAALRNRVSVPLLSIRSSPGEAVLARAAALDPEVAREPGARAKLSA